MEKNKVEIVKFLGEDVRVVNGEFIVLKDMFKVLGRVKKDGGWNDPKVRLISFLEDSEKIRDFGILEVSYGKKLGSKARKSYNVECLKLSTAYLSLLLFRPTKNAKNYKHKLEIWRRFINFLDDLIEKEYKDEIEEILIIRDEDKQKANISKSMEFKLNPKEVNNIINRIIGKLLKKNYITKGELRKLNNVTEIDLMFIRDKIHKRFNKLLEQSSNNMSMIDEDIIIKEIIESCKSYSKELYKKEEKRVKESNKEEKRFILHLRKKPK